MKGLDDFKSSASKITQVSTKAREFEREGRYRMAIKCWREAATFAELLGRRQNHYWYMSRLAFCARQLRLHGDTLDRSDEIKTASNLYS